MATLPSVSAKVPVPSQVPFPLQLPSPEGQKPLPWQPKLPIQLPPMTEQADTPANARRAANTNTDAVPAVPNLKSAENVSLCIEISRPKVESMIARKFPHIDAQASRLARLLKTLHKNSTSFSPS